MFGLGSQFLFGVVILVFEQVFFLWGNELNLSS